MAVPSFKVSMGTLQCVKSTSGSGSDDCYLQYNGVTFWGPQTLDPGNGHGIGTGFDVYSVGGTIVIELWDKDWPSNDDHIGSWEVPGQLGTYDPEFVPGPDCDDAKYTLSHVHVASLPQK